MFVHTLPRHLFLPGSKQGHEFPTVYGVQFLVFSLFSRDERLLFVLLIFVGMVDHHCLEVIVCFVDICWN